MPGCMIKPGTEHLAARTWWGCDMGRDIGWEGHWESLSALRVVLARTQGGFFEGLRPVPAGMWGGAERAQTLLYQVHSAVPAEDRSPH